VRFSPWETGFGAAVFTILISALFAFATRTVAVALFVVRPGTTLPAEAVAVSGTLVPEGVLAVTCITRLKLAVPFTAMLVPAFAVQVIVPVPPIAGAAQVQPAGGVMLWKVMFAGTVCVSVAVPAVEAAGPRLVITCVYVTLPPGATDDTDGAFVSERSACPAAATTSVAVALLLAELGSLVAELTVAVLLIAVPAAVPAFTVTT
jgi:hypothetical protein